MHRNKLTVKDVYLKHRFVSYIGYPVLFNSRLVKVGRKDNVRRIIKGVFIALGKTSEHQRIDRDDYVKILWENIEKGNYKHIMLHVQVLQWATSA